MDISRADFEPATASNIHLPVSGLAPSQHPIPLLLWI
jgi:hypothetical protein